MPKPTLRAIAAWSAALWGLLVAAAGVGHSVASWRTALSERGALDARFALMMAVGWVLVSSGAALAVGGWRLRRGPDARGGRATLAVAAFVLVLFAILSHVAGPAGIGGAAVVAGLLAWADLQGA